MQYETYNAANYTAFLNAYNYIGPLFPWDDYDDFDKVGIDQGGAQFRRVSPKLAELWVLHDAPAGECEVLARLQQDPALQTEAGGFVDAWLRVHLSGSGTLNMTLTVYNKTATRLPEAMFARFIPHTCNTTTTQCAVQKVAAAVATDNVVPGGAHHNHAMGPQGVACTCTAESQSQSDSTTGGYVLSSPDTRLLSVGFPSAFPTPLNSTANLEADGVALVLWQNIWNTNYIMWTEGDFQFRFNLELAPGKQ